MQSKTAKLVNEQRVNTILECYGADADSWPEEERAATIALINSSPELQQRQRESQQLDELLGVHQARESLEARADAATVASIINALPEQAAENTINLRDHVASSKAKKVAKHINLWWTYGGIAAAAVVMLAISVIIQQPSQPLRTASPVRTAALSGDVSQQEMDQWLWQEATGLNEELSAELAQEEADLPPITFMAMVELDMLPIDED